MEPQIVRSLIWGLLLHLLASVLLVPTMVFSWCVLGDEGRGLMESQTNQLH